MSGKTLGVIGLGRVGLEVAGRARAFQMRVLGYDPYLDPNAAAKAGIEVCQDMQSVLAESDYLTVHTPLNDDTRGLIGAAELARAKDGVRVINCARGGIIDDHALADAVRSGKVAAAAVDVYESEPPVDRTLIDLPQVVCTPHLGASTEEAQVTVAVAAAKQMVDALTKGETRFAVNLPSVAPVEMEALRPYLALAERMGVIAAGLLVGKPRHIKLTYSGEAAEMSLELVSASFVVGLTRDRVEEVVNLVSAPGILKQHGVGLDEVRSSETGNFTTLVTAEVTGDGEPVTVEGTVFGAGQLRIMSINGYPLETSASGALLILKNSDRPGLIGEIGTVLGKAGINIARMNFGRKRMHGDALTVLNLDVTPGPDVVRQVRAISGIDGVHTVSLPSEER